MTILGSEIIKSDRLLYRFCMKLRQILTFFNAKVGEGWRKEARRFCPLGVFLYRIGITFTQRSLSTYTPNLHILEALYGKAFSPPLKNVQVSFIAGV